MYSWDNKATDTPTDTPGGSPSKSGDRGSCLRAFQSLTAPPLCKRELRERSHSKNHWPPLARLQANLRGTKSPKQSFYLSRFNIPPPKYILLGAGPVDPSSYGNVLTTDSLPPSGIR